MRYVFGLGGAILMLGGLTVVVFAGFWLRPPAILISIIGGRMLGLAIANRPISSFFASNSPQDFGARGAMTGGIGVVLLLLCLAIPIFGRDDYFGYTKDHFTFLLVLDAIIGLAGGFCVMRYIWLQKTVIPSVVLAPEVPQTRWNWLCVVGMLAFIVSIALPPIGWNSYFFESRHHFTTLLAVDLVMGLAGVGSLWLWYQLQGPAAKGR